MLFGVNMAAQLRARPSEPQLRALQHISKVVADSSVKGEAKLTDVRLVLGAEAYLIPQLEGLGWVSTGETQSYELPSQNPGGRVNSASYEYVRLTDAGERVLGEEREALRKEAAYELITAIDHGLSASRKLDIESYLERAVRKLDLEGLLDLNRAIRLARRPVPSEVHSPRDSFIS